MTPPELRGLGFDEATTRARRLKLVATDCDGVLTDGGIFYSEAGEAMLKFSRRDGMGVELLRNAGIGTAIVTRENSLIVARRAEKLGVRLFAGVRDKKTWLEQHLAEEGPRGTQAAHLAFIGDDVNDLDIMHAIAPHGLLGAPADAVPAVRAVAHFVAPLAGGAGAFRAFADFILGLRDARRGHNPLERNGS